MEWKKQSEKLYFGEHLKIGVVAGRVGKTRQTVSEYLHSLPQWDEEQSLRKEQSRKRRKLGQLKWDRSNRAVLGAMKREHEQAVRELSAEKYR